jgi:hypothetical protein
MPAAYELSQKIIDLNRRIGYGALSVVLNLSATMALRHKGYNITIFQPDGKPMVPMFHHSLVPLFQWYRFR